MQLLRKLLFPISLIYALVVRIRNFCYDIDLFKSKTYTTPTVCIGNLSVGGTGKTPMVEFILRKLQKDYKLAVLSRGYKRKTAGFMIANAKTRVEAIGDEPYQIFKKFPRVSVAVDVDRRNGIEQLEKTLDPDIIILDDALQHRRVKPSHTILLTAYDNMYVNDWYLPTGDLRDSKYAANRADLIVITKCPRAISETEKSAIREQMKLSEHQQVLFSFLEYDNKLQGTHGAYNLQSFENEEITLVTGIANPKPLFDYLVAKGLRVLHLAYADHHFFTEKEVQLFKTKETIITTEKDYMRLAGKVENLYYLPIRHAFWAEDEAVIEAYLTGIMK